MSTRMVPSDQTCSSPAHNVDNWCLRYCACSRRKPLHPRNDPRCWDSVDPLQLEGQSSTRQSDRNTDTAENTKKNHWACCLFPYFEACLVAVLRGGAQQKSNQTIWYWFQCWMLFPIDFMCYLTGICCDEFSRSPTLLVVHRAAGVAPVPAGVVLTPAGVAHTTLVKITFWKFIRKI